MSAAAARSRRRHSNSADGDDGCLSNGGSSSSSSVPRRAKITKIEQIPLKETIALREEFVGKSCKLFYRSNPLKIVRARGQYMYNETGDELLDCINNVCHVGHCHPTVVAAGQKQMEILNTNNRFLHDNLVLYAQRLVSTFPPELSVVFFVNSGSEANDLALRMTRAHTGSSEFLTLDHAYHGHVSSLIDISPYKFGQLGNECPKGTHVVPCPDIYRGKYRDDEHPGQNMGTLYANEVKKICEDLKSQGKKPGCFIAESLQSCGGQIIFPDNYLSEVYRHVRKNGGICIADEVQVGFGRVGTNWWAFETYGEGVVPDIVTVGKPMGNGHPVAAVVTTKAVAASFGSTGMSYFNTYGGNPVSCAIASAVMDVIEDENLMEHAKKVGKILMDGFKKLQKKYSLIGDVRGRGMFIGVDLVEDREKRTPATAAGKHIVTRLREENILLQTDGPHDNVLKFKSPMVFQVKDAEKLLKVVGDILEEMESMKKFSTRNGSGKK